MEANLELSEDFFVDHCRKPIGFLPPRQKAYWFLPAKEVIFDYLQDECKSIWSGSGISNVHPDTVLSFTLLTQEGARRFAVLYSTYFQWELS